MEQPCGKDEQRIQLLTAEEQLEANSPEVKLPRPSGSYPARYRKLLVITPILVCLLLLTYWITAKSLRQFGDESFESAGNGTISRRPQTLPDGCHVRLFALAGKQMQDFEALRESAMAGVRPVTVAHDGQLVGLHSTDQGEFAAEILIHESPSGGNPGGSSFMAFVAGNHSSGVSLFSDNKNGTYAVCCVLPPECVTVTVRLYSYAFSAYRAITDPDTRDLSEKDIRTVHQQKICPKQSRVDGLVPRVPEKPCSRNVSLEPGSWTQVNGTWLWRSHKARCLVPDLWATSMSCAQDMFSIQFMGDRAAHLYNFYMTSSPDVLPKSFRHVNIVKFKYGSQCGDLHRSLYGVRTVNGRKSFVLVHCGAETFFKRGYTAFQEEIINLFAIAKEVQRISPGLRFVFILSSMNQQTSSVSEGSKFDELNVFSSAAINRWISDEAEAHGVSVFDDMYPRLIGQGHIGPVDNPLSNILLYHMCIME